MHLAPRNIKECDMKTEHPRLETQIFVRETMTEHFLQCNLGAAVFATAELKIFESICGGSKWSLAPIPKLSRKRMPFDRRVLFQL